MARLTRTLVAVVLAAVPSARPATAAPTLERLPLKELIRTLKKTPRNFAPGEPVMSPNGRWIAFTETTTGPADGREKLIPGTYVYDRTTRRLELVSVSTKGARGTGFGDGGMGEDTVNTGSISADGRYVVFVSGSPNLVPGDKNRRRDMFLRDRLRRTTVRVGRYSLRPETADPVKVSISRDGSRVLFQSTFDYAGDRGSGLTTFVWTRATGRVTAVDRIPGTKNGAASTLTAGQAAMSNDGRYVVFSTTARLLPADTDDEPDVYRRDVVAGRTVLVSDAATDAAVNQPRAYEVVPGVLTQSPPAYRRATVDRAGRWVALHANDNGNLPAQIVVRDLAGGAPRVLVRDGVYESIQSTTPAPAESPVIADDASAVVYLGLSYGNNPVEQASGAPHQGSAVPTVYRIPVAGGARVAVTPNPATVCGSGGCYAVDPGEPSARQMRYTYPRFAVGAGARLVLLVTDRTFTSDDPDESEDAPDPVDVYLWRA